MYTGVKESKSWWTLGDFNDLIYHGSVKAFIITESEIRHFHVFSLSYSQLFNSIAKEKHIDWSHSVCIYKYGGAQHQMYFVIYYTLASPPT